MKTIKVTITKKVTVDDLMVAFYVNQNKSTSTQALYDWLENILFFCGSGFGPEGVHEHQFNKETLTDEQRIEFSQILLDQKTISKKERDNYLKSWEITL